MSEWGAERQVTGAEVAGWLAAEGHEALQTPRLVGEGFDNFVFATATATHPELFVRATRRRIAIPDVRKEVALLPRLAARGLPVPVPAVVPAGVAELPWPWFAYRPIAGEELSAALLDGRDLRAVATRLGGLLRRLHAPEVLAELRPLLREDTFRRADMPYRVDASRQRLGQVHARFGTPLAPLHQVLDAAVDLPVLPASAAVHGDCHVRHVFVHGEQMSGLIDWGDAHLGHPALDLHVAWSLRPTERRALFAAYGPVDDATLRASRVIALYIGAVLALSAQDFGLPALERAALLGLERLAAG